MKKSSNDSAEVGCENRGRVTNWASVLPVVSKERCWGLSHNAKVRMLLVRSNAFNARRASQLTVGTGITPAADNKSPAQTSMSGSLWLDDSAPPRAGADTRT